MGFGGGEEREKFPEIIQNGSLITLLLNSSVINYFVLQWAAAFEYCHFIWLEISVIEFAELWHIKMRQYPRELKII